MRFLIFQKASNTDSSDVFGNAVSLSWDGLTLAVGATGERSNSGGVNGNETDNSLAQAGAVYVFVKEQGNWSQQAYIKVHFNFL